MKRTVRSALVATTLSFALATGGAAIVTLSTAGLAIAKSDKANSGGGNRGGNGNGGNQRAGKSGGDAAQTGTRGGQGGQKGSSQGGTRSSENRGNGGGNGGGSGGGNGKLFGFLPAHQSGGNGHGATKSATRTSVQSAPKSAPRPTPRTDDSDEDVDDLARYGNSWKSRLDDGRLDTHPRELGMWNSARRSPQAIANMVAKYDASREVTGAGGAIGFLVWSHQQMAEPTTAYFDGLQQAVTDERITVGAAERLLDGSLTEDSFQDAVDALGEDVEVVDGVVTCAEGAVCDPEVLAALQEDADALAFLASEDGADLAGARDAYAEADADRLAAEALVQPKFTPGDPDLQAQMLADVKDLLDIEAIETPEFVPPVPDEPEVPVEEEEEEEIPGNTEEDA
ncbi:hypothetical protein ACRDNQ_05035 [Palleronia sp. KMU-117]|uniref:hypothetical protein n=1 Tax=Palleronia sp. KMU-117 TaxID=3434108 RepID=UPI003D718462